MYSGPFSSVAAGTANQSPIANAKVNTVKVSTKAYSNGMRFCLKCSAIAAATKLTRNSNTSFFGV